MKAKERMLGAMYGAHAMMMRLRSERGLVTVLGAVGIGLAALVVGLLVGNGAIKLPK